MEYIVICILFGLNRIQETPTKEDKEFAKEIRNQRIVLFSR